MFGMARVGYKYTTLISKYNALEKYNLSSLLIYKIRTAKANYGYLIYALERTSKIWQNNEIAIMMYLAKSIMIEKIKM